MKKLFVFLSVAFAGLCLLSFISLTVLTATGRYVRYTDFTYNGKQMKMSSHNFHFKYHLYGKKTCKTTGMHYEWNS